jgi:hypothetical protein
MSNKQERPQRAAPPAPGLEPGQESKPLPDGQPFTVVTYDPLREPDRKFSSLKTRSPRHARTKLDRHDGAGEADCGERANSTLPPARPVSCQAAVEEFLEHLACQPGTTGGPIRPATLILYRVVLRGFVEWAEEALHAGVLLHNVGSAHVERFLFHRGLRRSTIASVLARVDAFYRWCVRKQYLPTNPAEHLDRSRLVGSPRFHEKRHSNGVAPADGVSDQEGGG